jgi:hypothetical protein
VYAVALYVDPASLKHELGAKYKGASAESLSRDDAFLEDCARHPRVERTLEFHITSGMVNRARFLAALGERMEPELKKAGQGAAFEEFKQQFDGVEVSKGTVIRMSTREGQLVTAVGGREVGTVRTPEVSSVLFGLYVGREPLQADIKAAFGKGFAAAMLV